MRLINVLCRGVSCPPRDSPRTVYLYVLLTEPPPRWPPKLFTNSRFCVFLKQQKIRSSVEFASARRGEGSYSGRTAAPEKKTEKIIRICANKEPLKYQCSCMGGVLVSPRLNDAFSLWRLGLCSRPSSFTRFALKLKTTAVQHLHTRFI